LIEHKRGDLNDGDREKFVWNKFSRQPPKGVRHMDVPNKNAGISGHISSFP